MTTFYVGDKDSGGTSFGQSATDLISFYGATPIVQRTNAAQAALTDSTGGTASTTFAAIAATGSYLQGDITAIKNALSQIVLSHAEIRTTLVNLGLIKGS